MSDISAIEPTQLAVVNDGPGALLSAIVQLAKDPAVDVAKLEALLGMQARMEGRQAEAEFNRAFHAMEPNLPRVKKNGHVEYKKGDKVEKAFKFARWEDVDAGIRPILREHGFSLAFDTAPRQGDGGGLVVTGTLLHTAGHSRSSSIALALDSSGGKNNIQGIGSTFSYGARYVTRMLLNIVTEDDDDDGVRGGVVFLSPEESAELLALVTETNTQEGRFLAVMCSDVRSIEEVEAKDFVRLKNALLQKRASMGGRQ